MREIVLYLFVSVIALGVDVGVFSLAMRIFGASWMIAAAVGFLAGVFLAYFMSVRVVFKARRFRHHQRTEVISFVAIGVMGLLITQLVLWLAIDGMNWNPELSRLGAAGVTFLFNFNVRKFLLFRLGAD